jgi:endonuclease YncB( thermonuclease family)
LPAAYKLRTTERTQKDLYTYNALVERVVDGDTLKVHVDLGFGQWTRQTLRLRGLDCPEVGTRDGDAAKAFVQSYLKEASQIVIRSSKSDKYDRYLADIFIPQDKGEDIYLNDLLLEKGQAERWEG